MLVDINELEHNFNLDADIAIVGAGAAGITIAKELLSTGLSVLLIESGGFEFTADTNELNAGHNSGHRYDVQYSRQRFFGGTTNHWTGMCAPLNDVEMKDKPWLPLSAWPITRQQLEEYYVRAHQYCELGEFDYSEKIWDLLDYKPLGLMPEKAVSGFWRMSPPTRFGQAYREEIVQAKQVTVLLNANVTKIDLNISQSAIEQLTLQSLKDKQGTVKAKQIVLACGGLENARILLNNDHQQPLGLANNNGYVGKCFMEHPHIGIGHLVATNTNEFLDRFAIKKNIDPGFWSGVALSAEQQEKNQCLAAIATFVGAGVELSSGIKAVQEALQAFRPTGKSPDSWLDTIGTIIMDLDDVIPAVYRKLRGKQLVEFPAIEVAAISEQAPNPKSTVTLSDERDALGQRKLSLNWQLSALDKRTLQVLAKTVAEEVGRLGIGRFKTETWLEGDDNIWSENTLWRGNHHMGTTRMSDDARHGVVDADCKSHDIDNLYIAGSSVFPTCGYANPTLTIVTLAVRLADHLKSIS